MFSLLRRVGIGGEDRGAADELRVQVRMGYKSFRIGLQALLEEILRGILVDNLLRTCGELEDSIFVMPQILVGA